LLLFGVMSADFLQLNVVIKKHNSERSGHIFAVQELCGKAVLCIGNPHFPVDISVDNGLGVNRLWYVL